MIDCKCSFTATMIKDDFACEKAQLVTRRAGPDIACSSEYGSEQCKKLYAAFKQVGLQAFDAEDDLSKTSHSVFVRIQFGGLLGLANNLDKEHGTTKVDNIFKLVSDALNKYSDIDKIPNQEFVEQMLCFKIKRKKKR